MKRAIPYLAVFVCVGFGAVGYLSATRIVYLHKRATWFPALEAQAAEELRRKAETTYAISVSSLVLQNTPSSIQDNVNYLSKLRSRAPQELWPVLDLRLAKDYAMMARLEEQSGSSAAQNQQTAQALLRSLGWTDVSEGAVTKLGDEQLQSRFKR